MKRLVELLFVLVLLVVLAYVFRPKVSIFFNDKGVECYNRGSYQEAISYFKKSLKVKSSSSTYFNLANAYRESGDEEAAIKEYKNLIQGKHKEASIYFALSQIYSNREMYAEALGLLKKAETEFPAELAIEKVQEEISSEYMISYVNKGIEAYLNGDKTKANSLLNKALEIDPNYIQLYYFLGYFYIEGNNYSQAEDLLKKALQMKPDSLQARTLLGDLYYKKGNYEKAISEYRSGLLIDFDNSYLHNSLGIAFMNIEHYREAITHLKKALEILPDNLNFRYSLASLYRDEGLLNKAVLEYKKILKSFPEYPYVHSDLGDIYTQQGRKEEAIKEYYIEIDNCRKKLKITPDDINTLNGIAYSYSAVGNHSKAKAIINDIIKRYPSWRQAYLTLSRIEENMGDKNKAVVALEKAKALFTYPGFIDKDISRLKKTSDLSIERTVFFDKIYLKNGWMIEGIILQETSEKVVLEIYTGKSRGTTIISRDIIKNIFKARNIEK